MVNNLYYFISFSCYFCFNSYMICGCKFTIFCNFTAKNCGKGMKNCMKGLILRKLCIFNTPIPRAVPHPRLRPQEALSEVTGSASLRDADGMDDKCLAQR